MDVIACAANVSEEFFTLVCEFVYSFSLVHMSFYEVFSFE